MSSWTTERARVASLSRSRTPDDPELIAARERMQLAHLEESIRKAVEAAPPLPEDAKRRIAAILTRAANREAPAMVRGGDAA